MTGDRHIRLIATDIDGTLIDSDLNLSAANKAALERCAAEGICTVIATGRSRSTVPPQVLAIEGIQYLVCANGAKIYEMRTGEQIYAAYLSIEAMESVWAIIENPAIMCEVFWDGSPYVSERCYHDLERFGIPEYLRDYILGSRVPVHDLAAFAREHISEVENLNFNYANEDLKHWLYEKLRGSDLYTLTASMMFNFEIGGVGVNKAAAIRFICERRGILREETLCIGDNDNDIEMIRFAGIGVACGNASAAVKESADIVTLDNNDDGVAFALNTLI